MDQHIKIVWFLAIEYIAPFIGTLGSTSSVTLVLTMVLVSFGVSSLDRNGNTRCPLLPNIGQNKYLKE